jgi:hypothetical protein
MRGGVDPDETAGAEAQTARNRVESPRVEALC